MLGCATSAVRVDGFTSFAGTRAYFRPFANGVLQYLTNSAQAGRAFAIVNPMAAKWTSLGMHGGNLPTARIVSATR